MKFERQGFCKDAFSKVFEKFGAVLFLAVFFGLSFEPGNVCGEEPTNAIAQVKVFLENPPAVQNMVFGQPYKETRDKTGFHGMATLFSASFQGDCFALATLKTPDEIPQMTLGTLGIVGKDHSFRWGIIGMTLYRGSTNGSETDPHDSAVQFSESLEPTLNKPMNLGISQAMPGTIHVSANGDFEARLADYIPNWGKETNKEAKLEGRFIFSQEGLLDEAVWHPVSVPGFVFHIKYFYKDKTKFPPSSWVESAVRDGINLVPESFEIYKFEVATSELPDSFFLPERFMGGNKTNLPPVGPIVLTRSNGQTLWLQNGKFQKTNIQGSFEESSRSLWMVRIILGVIALGGPVIIIWSALARARRRK
ncbi:MAG TPA: hypothetical protein DCQ92_05175 [Verrucomicrobia subdivision 3 bacterium]|nr:hypothetical protein [Limisphaerales bacterium]